jgi:hypothetical protein
MTSSATFAAVGVALYAAHHVGDHWLQRHAEAIGKGGPGWPGRLLCARHVATLTATKLTALLVTAAAVHLPLSLLGVVVGLVVDAASHYVIDRRAPLAALARLLGKAEFHALGDGATAPVGTGAYALDQSWHIAWLWITALIIAAA